MDERASAAAAASVVARLSRLLAKPVHRYAIFRVDGQAAGFVTSLRLARLREFDRVFEADADGIRFLPSLATAEARTGAMAEVARALAAEGALTAWRDERYAVRAEFDAEPWFLLERAAARYFGVRTWAAHVNGLVRRDGETRMWFARRSPAKAIDPGMLDNLVGGGIRAGASVAATVIAEAWEEAGIAASLARAARCTGTLSVCRDQPDGLQRETIFAHDLDLPAAFEPAGQDGETSGHRLVDLAEAARLIGLDAGADQVTGDASLVVLDCLLRHGVFAGDAAWLPALRALCAPAALSPPRVSAASD